MLYVICLCCYLFFVIYVLVFPCAYGHYFLQLFVYTVTSCLQYIIMDVCWICIIAIPVINVDSDCNCHIYLHNCLLFLVVYVLRRYFFSCITVVAFGELCTVRTNQES